MHMYFENDPHIIEWLARWLEAPSPHIRWRATELLAHVDCRGRAGWLERMTHDRDPVVRRTAHAALRNARIGPEGADADLFSSDFMSDLHGSEFDWEWEYGLRLCAPDWIPLTVVRVWMREEDDAAARAIALLHATSHDGSARDARGRVTQPSVESHEEVIPVIIYRRAVNQFTRSPRSIAEARLWHVRGRPLPP